MLSDEEKEIFNNLKEYMQSEINKGYHKFIYNDLDWDFKCIDCINAIDKVLKQSKEIEELKETLKCTQNSWYEDTIKIEEMKKQIDLDNECEIALNNRIMDLENADKKWEDKIKAKTIEIKNRPVKDEFITVSQGKLNTIIDMESLLEKE